MYGKMTGIVLYWEEQDKVVLTMTQQGETLRDRVSALLRERDMRPYHLAKAAGVSSGTVSKLLDGMIDEPRRSTVKALADALDVDVDYLLGEQSERRRPAPHPYIDPLGIPAPLRWLAERFADTLTQDDWIYVAGVAEAVAEARRALHEQRVQQAYGYKAPEGGEQEKDATA